MSGSIIPTVLGRGKGLPGIGHHSLFGLLWSASELWWYLWVWHVAYANILQ